MTPTLSPNDAAANEMLRILPLLHHTVSALSLLSHEVKDLRGALGPCHDATVKELCHRLTLSVERMSPPAGPLNTGPEVGGGGDAREKGDLRRAVVYAEERRDFYINEAQRLALLVRKLGGDPETNPQMAEGCNSAISPCSHQRHDPTTICAYCDGANAAAEIAKKRKVFTPAEPPVSPAGGEDLEGLSVRATPGFIAAAGYGTDIRASDGVIAMTSPTRNNGKDDRAFIVAIWNAYRSGALLPAESRPVEQGEPAAWAYEEKLCGKWCPFVSRNRLKDKPYRRNIRPLYAHPAPAASRPAADKGFAIGQRVRKVSGSSWQGTVVGFYSTDLTPDGICVESEREPGSVQIYPAKALALTPTDGAE